MQPPGDYLLDPKMNPPKLGTIIPVVAVVLGFGAFATYWLNRPIEERANLAVKNSCGDLEAVTELEKIPSATKKAQVEELGKTIKFLKEKCEGNTGKAVERLEKVKAKWEASAKIQEGRPVSDLSWKPKNQIRQRANPQNMLPRKIMRS